MALIFDEWGNFRGYTSNGKDAVDYWYRDKYKLIPQNLKGIKERKIKELSKERTIVDCVIRPLQQERVFEERFIQYNSLENVKLRQEQFRIYYYGSNLNIEELKQEELKRMIESYEKFKSLGGKSFYNWLKAYVVIDYELLLKFVKIISSSKQQKYKKKKTIEKVFGNLAEVSKKVEKDSYNYDYETRSYNNIKTKEEYEEQLAEAQFILMERHKNQLKGFLDSIEVDERYKEIKYKSALRSQENRIKAEEKEEEFRKIQDAKARGEVGEVRYYS